MYRSGLHSIVYITAPSIKIAKELAHDIIQKDLAACVNLLPNITSIYKWNGQIQEASESLMMIKTRTSRIEELTNFVKVHHPYEVCEVISTKIENGNIPYLNWISESVPEVPSILEENEPST
ncbi:Divalent ion tolerance protein, CutA,Nitrogen regulatory protein PII/ATP phosphoribosyltransferase, C- [Cinara cedri]|uniref:Divalent ion tolerance protein, CutA,Nitrogen regulatory protein PII/ATP phosphoribosyltransferase, C n=1 Tax=Cinara cedri TaxID=506608 RepID=A0A5E4MF25_9HEMI|nr:Divalent ion tolerance protein, CutA,Nitrogen regulatory protein PII/ATP phosphoribosyltransferase, C- [Cinara cedri]